VALIPENLDGQICSTGFSVLRPTEELLSGYLFGFVRSPRFIDTLVSMTTGASYPAVSERDIKGLSIPMPPLTEQERIVKLLDEADAIRKLRAKADQRTADLIPALFHEMFGDPATNPMGWPLRSLQELSDELSDGPFGSNLKSSHYTERGVRVVRLQNIGLGRFVNLDRAFISQEHFDRLRKHSCVPGDVLVGTLGNPNLRACILPRDIPIALNKADCIQIRPRNDIANSSFICWLLNLPSTLTMVSGMILGQTRSRISMGRLSRLEVPVPPLPLQQEFAHRVSELHDLQARQTDNHKQAEVLFQAMLHGAFGVSLQHVGQ
jgi:type I restriction enzyme S subunit